MEEKETNLKTEETEELSPAEAKKEKRLQKKKERKEKTSKLWQEFKAFINKGNALNLAIGVVIGGVFNSVVTALTNILLSICTWGVPGGIAGLVTVLPPINASQDAGTMGWQNSYTALEFQEQINAMVADGESTTLFINSYVLHGSSYYYAGAAVIDWGAFINAIITFFIVCLTLFVIVKVYNYLKKQSQRLADEAKERYYLAHPEERPLPPEPGKPEPTEKEILQQILLELKKSNGEAPKEEAKTE